MDLSLLVQRDWLTPLLEEIVEQTNVPGLAATVNVEGCEISAAAGKADVELDSKFSANAQFELSCMMKLLSSFVVMQLVEEGIVDLATPISEYAPELGDCRGLTFSHLMSHTSGYRGLDPLDPSVKWNYSWSKFRDHLSTAPQLFDAGLVYNYEHTEHVLIGFIAQRLTGSSMSQMIKERILNPLGIDFRRASADETDTQVVNHILNVKTGKYRKHSIPSPGAFWGDSLSNLKLSLADLVCVGAASLAKPSEDFERDIVYLPRSIRSHQDAERLPVAAGLMWGRFSSGLFGHNGSAAGQACALRVHREKKIVLAVGTNAWHPVARDRAIGRIFRMLGVVPEPPQSESHVSFEEIGGGFSVQQLVGTYEGSFLGQINVVSEPSVLLCKVGTEKGFQFSIIIGKNGECDIEADRPISFTFFRNPRDGKPSAMLGVHAYARA